MVTATLYYNTGFNGINWPADDNAIIAAAYSSRQTTALDLCQIYHLDIISLKMFENEIGDLEYICLTRGDETAWYRYNGVYQMTSADVAAISVSMDAITTAGGVNYLTIVDGIAVRTMKWDTTIMNGHNGEPQYSIADPLMPRMQSERHVLYSLFSDEGLGKASLHDGATNASASWSASTTSVDFYGTTYKLHGISSAIDEAKKPITIEVENSGELPSLYTFSENYNSARYSIGKERDSRSKYSIMGIEKEWPGMTFYDGTCLDTAKDLYSFGINNPIVYSYRVPSNFIQKTTKSSGAYTQVTGRYVYAEINDDIRTVLYDGVTATNINTYKSVVTDVLLASAVTIRLHAVGTGQMSETTPPNLRKYSAAGPGGADFNYKIRVYLLADPTPYGAPYYKLDLEQEEALGGQVNSTTYILQGAIRGSSWQPLPVSFTGFNMNTELNELAVRNSVASQVFGINFDAQSEILTAHGKNWDEYNAGMIGGISARDLENVGSALGSIFDTAANEGKGAGSTSSGIYNTFSSGYSDKRNSVSDIAFAVTNFISDIHQQKYAMAKEIAMFNVQHTAVQQDLEFAVTDGSQMMFGNGAIVEIVLPRERDILNMIKFIQMYGIAVNFPLQGGGTIASTFDDTTVNGSIRFGDYYYVQTAGLSLQNNLTTKKNAPAVPKSVLEAAAAAFNTGVRIWKTRPDPRSYPYKFKN